MTYSFTNRSVVVTGAASGIGAALARQLAAERARLLICDLDTTRLEELAASLRASGATVLTQQLDVADPAQLAQLAQRAQDELGGTDVLFNNAGVALMEPVRSLKLEDAQWLMGINFWGVVNGCRLFLPQMTGRPGGACIVNISSIFAMLSMPTQSMYNAAKAAVRGFSDSLREEVRDSGIQVLCVHPGGIRTRIAEQARMGDISGIGDSPQVIRERFATHARTTPEQAAQAILQAVRSGRTRLLIGADARIGDLIYRLMPARASAVFTAMARRRRNR